MKDPGTTETHGPGRTRGTREVRAEGSPLNRQVLLPAERFIYSETISGALLLVCTIAALVWANSPWSQSYFVLRDTPVSLQIGAFSLALDLQHWINDGLMAIFFFVVALEIKRELLHAAQSDARKAALPVAAALGGMILPAGIYLALNFGGAGAAGWGIPMATDIALAVLGWMLAMRWLGFRSTLAYLFPAVLFWAAMLKSGVHATVAGVILGAITPAKSLGRKSTFVETERDIMPDVLDSLDKEKSERDEVIFGRIEELARQTESPLERLSAWFIRGRVICCCPSSPW